jgi:hypothetical protein
MMNKKTFLLRIATLLFCAGTAFSQDHGLTLRSSPLVYAGGGSPRPADFTGTAVPWFSGPLGEQGDIYFSAGISAESSEGEWKPVFEPYRFGFSYRFDSGPRLEAGRLSYREPLSLVCSGLFDGVALDFDLRGTRLSAGVFYTGLLYKKSAYIVMSPGDYADYYDRDHYFSSRRMLFSLGWGLPVSGGAGLDLEMIGQVDLNKPDAGLIGDRRVHSQYALAKFTLPFLRYFNAETGAVLGLIEGGRDAGFCFAASADLAWLPPGGGNDRLSLGMAVSSGVWGDGVKAFLPVNTIARGRVLGPRLSGLAVAEGEYSARIHPSLSTQISAAYFLRTDTRTYNDPELDLISLSPLLGGEVYCGFTCAPASDMSVSLGGGAFFPQLGRAFESGASPRGRVSLEVILSF